jgi:hypothetical protein
MVVVISPASTRSETMTDTDNIHRTPALDKMGLARCRKDNKLFSWRKRGSCEVCGARVEDAPHRTRERTGSAPSRPQAVACSESCRDCFRTQTQGERIGCSRVEEEGQVMTASRSSNRPCGHEARRRHSSSSGLVACGLCADAIGDPREALMIGRYLVTNLNPYTLVCKGPRSQQRFAHGRKRYHDFEIHVAVHRIRPLIVEKLLKLRDPAVAQAVLARWRDEPEAKKPASMRDTIDRRLAELDAEEASLDRQARGAMRLAASEQPGVAAEAERVLAEVNADRLALKATREGLQAQIARLPVERSRAIAMGKL